MGDTARRVFTAVPSSRRGPAVTTTVIPAPKVFQPGTLPGIGGATRDRCACGRVVGTTAEVWQELVGGHLRAFCAGCSGESA